MFCILLEENDPYFCLAAEEYLLKNYREDIFMLWQSHDAVVIGKHQNALAEINYRYARENGISIARRISGGGTVFHDKGNVNFSYIKNVAGPLEISFSRFTEPITGALKKLGIRAETSGRNDLLVNGKKISGNAEHIFKNRVLHHGTLLFNSDLIHLADAIRVTPGKYAGKAVESNRSRVANLSGFLPSPIDLHTFIRFLIEYQLQNSAENSPYLISDGDKEKIRELAREKFETPDWQFGYSPAYSFTHSTKIGGKLLDLKLEVRNGKILSARIGGDYYPPEKASRLENLLLDKPHLYEPVESAHAIMGLSTAKDLIYSYF